MSTDSKRVMETGNFGSSASCGPVRVEALAMRGGERRGGGRSGGRGGRRGARVAHGGTAASPCPRCDAQCTDVGSCPAISVKCYVCGNYGHHARMCKCKNSVKKMYEIEVNTEKSDNDDSIINPSSVVSRRNSARNVACLLAHSSKDLCQKLRSEV
ncbi:unnamed protein product [Parnassius apollo]|uniref:(apollo) hypothetical protein n=1 Tax=Parnassius apollo TaxID=110799 RepID=A0A8S3WET0_PARAO|nr:unnamed protein product [Parnassius apollo]